MYFLHQNKAELVFGFFFLHNSYIYPVLILNDKRLYSLHYSQFVLFKIYILLYPYVLTTYLYYAF